MSQDHTNNEIEENSNPKKVMTFGTFDIFHPGHENYLKEAKSHGDTLITVVARDETVRRVKGETPKTNEKERQKTLIESGIPDEVILGELKDKYNLIRQHRPDVICLGYDQYAFTQQLQKLLIEEGLNAEIIRLNSFKPNEYKSSILKSKLEPENE